MNGARNHPLYGAVDDIRPEGHLRDGQSPRMQIETRNSGVDDDNRRLNASNLRVTLLSVMTLFVVIVVGIVCFDEKSVYNNIQQQHVSKRLLDNHLLIEDYIRVKQQGDASNGADMKLQRPAVLRGWPSSMISQSNEKDDDGKDVARFYKDQPVDHFSKHDHRTWANRYYQSTKYFAGPGSPILMIVGGEGSLDHGILYPFVKDILAAKFGAAVLQIEHVSCQETSSGFCLNYVNVNRETQQSFRWCF